MTRFAVAACAVFAIACGGPGQGEGEVAPPATTTPGEAVGTSGTNERPITISGCITRGEADGYVLTSEDDALVRRETGTAGHQRDDADSAPADPNRGAEDERLRHAQNPSAEFGRFRLEGDAERMAMYVGREVEVQGHVVATDTVNDTPALLRVETIDATGPRCR